MFLIQFIKKIFENTFNNNNYTNNDMKINNLKLLFYFCPLICLTAVCDC